MPDLVQLHKAYGSLSTNMPPKNSYLYITSLLISFLQCCTTSNDTITQNQPFRDGDILVSSGSYFALGFFSPGNSTNRYVGIWYNKVSEQTVVWVANRNSPINGFHGVLSIENTGNLVLRYQNSDTILWSTNVPGTSSGNSYFVQLKDSGNLVLCQGDSNTAIILWESFHYPTNTLLPNMKQGINLTSGLHWSLTSWKSRDDPATGDLQYGMELTGSPPQLFLFNNSEIIWRPGPWNGMSLSGQPFQPSNSVFSSYYVENEDEVSISFGLRDPSILSKITFNESGKVARLTWQEDRWVEFWSFPKDQCDYYNHCGSFSNCDADKLGQFECECLPGYEPKVQSEWSSKNGTSGCTKKTGEQTCGESDVVGFLKLTSVKVPDTTNAIANQLLGLKECSKLCLKNCSCTAYTSANVSNGGSGCITWYGDLIDMRKFPNAGQDIYIRVPASELAYLKNTKGLDRKRLSIILVPSIGGILLLVLAILLVLKKPKAPRQYGRKLLSFNLDPVSSHRGSSRTGEIIDENTEFSVFDFKTIISATNSFSSVNKLGEGGFGSVFKGRLQNGTEIAVKRLSRSSGQGIEEFKNEVSLIARLQHRNLVKILGCCIEQEEKMLVYEYLPNKGLDNFIFEKGALLDWSKRLDIILGIARGIVYIHRDSRLKIIHRDLKASNVLLDANMEPKISDFGMARIFNADQMEAKTQRVVGTYGYMSPEYAMQGLFSERSDVFSYGVLLLEIISGQRNNSYFSENTVNLTGYVWELWEQGNPLDLVDPAIGESYDEHEVVKCIQIGLLCVQEHAVDRPTMSEVLSMLCNETSIPSTSPKQPAFVIKRFHRKGEDELQYSSPVLLREFDDFTELQPR